MINQFAKVVFKNVLNLVLFVNNTHLILKKIDFLKSFCFFEIDQEYKSKIIKALNNTKWRGVKIKIEIAKEFSKERSFKPKKNRNKSKNRHKNK